ncbi:hypothetical protein Emag_006992 [Eimeria magna]
MIQLILPISDVLLLSPKNIRLSRTLRLLLGLSETVAFHSVALTAAILAAAAARPTTSASFDSVSATVPTVPSPPPLPTAFP